MTLYLQKNRIINKIWDTIHYTEVFKVNHSLSHLTHLTHSPYLLTGWPERVQIGLLMGDMMEKIEKSYEAEKNNTKSPAARDVAALPINSFSNK